MQDVSNCWNAVYTGGETQSDVGAQRGAVVGSNSFRPTGPGVGVVVFYVPRSPRRAGGFEGTGWLEPGMEFLTKSPRRMFVFLELPFGLV